MLAIVVNLLQQNSIATLYLIQVATFSAASICARRGDHARLTYCYPASALLHALFGACHALRFE